MNFHKLYRDQVEDFLRLNGQSPQNDIYTQAADLFNEPSTRFTFSVINLYVASLLKPIQTYTVESILNAGPEIIQQFAVTMNIPGISKERIVDILDLAGLIYPLSIAQIISKFVNTEFYYEIPTNESIQEEGTVDQLYRHIIDEFWKYGYETTGYYIHKEGFKQYLVLKPEIERGFIYDHLPEDENISATPENMINIFGSEKIRVPINFVDRVVIEVNDDYEYLDNTVFTLSKIETPDQKNLRIYNNHMRMNLTLKLNLIISVDGRCNHEFS